MNNTDHISESLKPFFWVKILKFFDMHPGWKNSDKGSRIWDGKKLDPGYTSRIRNTAANNDDTFLAGCDSDKADTLSEYR
jgi:hypothetical protein